MVKSVEAAVHRIGLQPLLVFSQLPSLPIIPAQLSPYVEHSSLFSTHPLPLVTHPG